MRANFVARPPSLAYVKFDFALTIALLTIYRNFTVDASKLPSRQPSTGHLKLSTMTDSSNSPPEPAKFTISKRRAQLMNFMAGGLAGSVASTLTAPLEIVKTQLQSSRIGSKATAVGIARKIFETDGPKGFFKGIAPLLVGIIPTRAIYFWAYSSSKESLAHRLGDSPLNHIASAFAAGITSNTVSLSPFYAI
jgi:hypothetical protein